MTLQADIATDYLIFDGNETITFTPQNPAATAVNSVVANRSILTRRDLMGIGIEPSDVVFSIAVSTLGSAVPKLGDKITDANNVSYLLVSAELRTMDTRWRCIARKTA